MLDIQCWCFYPIEVHKCKSQAVCQIFSSHLSVDVIWEDRNLCLNWCLISLVILILLLPRERGLKPPPKGFFYNFWRKETPNFALYNFNGIHIKGYDQIEDPPQNLGGRKVKIKEVLEKCQNYRVFTFSETF